MYVRWLVTWDSERWWWCSVARPRRLTNRGSRPAHRPFPGWWEQRNRPEGLLSRRWLLTHLFASFHHNFSVYILCSCHYISLYSIVSSICRIFYEKEHKVYLHTMCCHQSWVVQWPAGVSDSVLQMSRYTKTELRRTQARRDNPQSAHSTHLKLKLES